MRVRLEYGKSGLVAELPDENLVAVLGLNTPPPLVDPESAIFQVLRNPINALPLRDLPLTPFFARRGDPLTACIVVCDVTRPVPNPELLPPILAELEAGGIPRSNVTILVATGTHRPNV